MHADAIRVFCPFASKLIGPPTIIRSAMSVLRIASASADPSVLPARLQASAAIIIASNVNPTLSAWNISCSFGNCFLNAASTRLLRGAFGLYHGTLEMQ
jgi:hypothetical protein